MTDITTAASEPSQAVGAPVEQPVRLDPERAGIAWELALLAQTLEFSDDVRTKIQRGADEIERLRAEIKTLHDQADVDAAVAAEREIAVRVIADVLEAGGAYRLHATREDDARALLRLARDRA